MNEDLHAIHDVPFETEPLHQHHMFDGVAYAIRFVTGKWHSPGAKHSLKTRIGLQDADIVLLLYDVWDRLTFDTLPEILEYIRRTKTTMPLLLVIATNTDIARETWDVS
jgi:hypothetical protein